MINAYSPLPRDRAGDSMQDYPVPTKALARYPSENATVSSLITVTDSTTTIEVAAINGPAVIRWVPVTETAAVSPFGSVISSGLGLINFDNVIPKDTVRRFAIPIESFVGYSIVGLNKQNGLYNRVAVKTSGISSVYLTEY